MQKSFCHIYSELASDAIKDMIYKHLPDENHRRILIKPNWVNHEEHPEFPIHGLVTCSSLIDATIAAALEKYPGAESITVGDVPLQTCNWNLLSKQLELDKLVSKYSNLTCPQIHFLDLRQERYDQNNGFFVKNTEFINGDPLGYREVILDESSFLEPVSHLGNRFRVSDYNPQDSIKSHQKGSHRYLIAGSVLNADLVINIPKMKTHQKAGITGALKNIVGINGEKAFLVHHRLGTPAQGGDEFPPNASLLILAQVRLREALQKRSRTLFFLGRAAWRKLRKIYGIETDGTAKNMARPGKMYIGAGSWYGNDTIWRMVYDLNNIIRHAPREGGRLHQSSQREYVAILDGMISGEGNGPLQPLLVETGIVAISNNPFLMDMVTAQLMGLDWHKIPILRNYRLFHDYGWVNYDPDLVTVHFNGQEYVGISSLPVLHSFIPPPGWKGHIEIGARR